MCHGIIMQVLQEFLRILLEVINCILSLNLTRNPELVYALLHKQEMFGQLRGQQGLSEPVENLQVSRPQLLMMLQNISLHCGYQRQRVQDC